MTTQVDWPRTKRSRRGDVTVAIVLSSLGLFIEMSQSKLIPVPIIRAVPFCTLNGSPVSCGRFHTLPLSRSRVRREERHVVTTHPYEDGTQETRQDFTVNDFRIKRAFDSLTISAKSIRSGGSSAEDIAARVHTLRHLLKQAGHDV